MKIPSNNNWTQLNAGDQLGVLHETHNIDLNTPGILRLSKKTVAHITSDATTGDADLGQVLALPSLNGTLYAITDDAVFSGNLDGNGFTEVAGSASYFAGSDGIAFNSRMYVSDTTQVDYWNGSSWTSGVITGLTASFPHPMAIFDSLPTYKLALADGNTVKVYDTSHNAYSTTLTLPNNYTITCLTYRNGYLYIGTKENEGAEAKIFMWSGSGANAQYAIPMGTSWVFSMTPYKTAVAAMTADGELVLVSGGQRQQLAALPIFFNQTARWITGDALSGKVLSNGMCTIGDSIYVNVNGTLDSGFVEGMKTGVWCFHPNTGLNHYATGSSDEVVIDKGLSLASNELTTTAAHSLLTGDVVAFESVTGLVGVAAEVNYYVIVTGASTIKLAPNKYDAYEGNAMTITGTPGGSDGLRYTPNTDYGSSLSDDVGAIAPITYLNNVKVPYGTNIVFGSTGYNPSNTSINAVHSFSDQKNVGWFTTQKIYTPNVTQTWKSVYTFLKGILGTNEEAVIKYKTEDRLSLPTKGVECSWVDADTFTTTDFTLRNNIAVGDEVVLIRGYGQGQIAHISEVTLNAGTTEVTLDESWGSAGETTYINVTGFKKIGTVTSTRPHQDFFRSSIDKHATSVQIKVVLCGNDIEIPMLELTNSVDKSAV